MSGKTNKQLHKKPEEIIPECDHKFSCSTCGETRMIDRSTALSAAMQKLTSQCCTDTNWMVTSPDKKRIYSPHAEVSIG